MRAASETRAIFALAAIVDFGTYLLYLGWSNLYRICFGYLGLVSCVSLARMYSLSWVVLVELWDSSTSSMGYGMQAESQLRLLSQD